METKKKKPPTLSQAQTLPQSLKIRVSKSGPRVSKQPQSIKPPLATTKKNLEYNFSVGTLQKR